jgi:Suppressor of fused protein (SUFU)
MASDAANEELATRWYERKSALMEASLGKEYHTVMHAIIPYAIGGGLDLYYYPNGLSGTAIATKELSELPNAGSSNDAFRCYELVMFTKQKLDLDAAKDESTAFGRQHANINAILHPIARYSAEAKLNPNETCEFPADMARVGGKCLIFDGYACHSDDMVENFGLLAVIEVFRSEMDYARNHGASELIARLKSNGHYPYSDLDREPVF